MNAYDKIYLEDAMHNLGVMADCGANTLCIPRGEFWARFLASSIAERFSKGAVDIIAGHSGVELALMVVRETGRPLQGCSPTVSISSPEYWAGMSLARYQWKSSMTFKEMSRCGLGLEETVKMFNPLHEADWTVFSGIADEIVGECYNPNSWLKNLRRMNGLTQKELSAISGVPIRLIRAYEQGTVSTAKAEHQTILQLRQALKTFAL